MRVKVTLRCNECKQINYNTMKNTGTVLLCSLCVGACIWVFDAVAMLAVNALIGIFAG